MSDTRTGRARQRILKGIVVVGLVLAAILLTAWAGNQVRWRTHTFPADPKTGVAIAIDYPDGWRLHVRDFSGNNTNGGVKQITFLPPEPTGVTRWWRDYVLRQKPPTHIDPRIELSIWPDSFYKNRGPDQVWKNYGVAKSLSTTSTKCSLGSAIEIRASIDMSARFAAGAGTSGTSTMFSFHQLTISPDTPLLPPGMRFNLSRLSTEGLFVGIDPQFCEMAHRLRLVQNGMQH